MCSLFLMDMQFYDNNFEVGEGVRVGLMAYYKEE